MFHLGDLAQAYATTAKAGCHVFVPGFTVDGPFAPFNFDGMSAVSTFSDITQDAFASFTIKNNPDAEENTQLIHIGLADVPFSNEGGQAVPEPGTWALMIGGFGLVGAAMRRRQSFRTVTA